MRQEDKEVDGPEIEHAEERKRDNELVEEKEDELFDLDGLPETTLDKDRSASVIAAMQAILGREQIVINDLKLSKRHLVALESLKEAVEGKDMNLSQFVYAEDRRALLEQSLAVLQPEIASMQGIGDQFKDLIDKVGDLREKLDYLEDAEEELVEGRMNHVVAKDANDTDDKDDDELADDVANAAKRSRPKKKPKAEPDGDQSLDGPERPVEPKGPSTLVGPERKEAPKGPSTLEGPERKAEPKEPSSLTGAERKEPAKGGSTLEGAERKVAPKEPTSLGDPREIDAIATANTPRWRRPGG